MNIKIRDININYVQYGSGPDVVLLHGWGQNIAMMDPVGIPLSKNFKITILDLPGYGNSGQPTNALTLDDYYEIIDEFFSKLNIKKPILIGHSFGGRIALIYAAKKEVKKLILFGTPFEKRLKKLSLKIKILKLLKKIPFLKQFEEMAKKHIGSTDYRNANPIMRQILVNTVNADLSDLAKNISCPTILIWGSEDHEVPVEEAEKLETLIKDAGLIIYSGCTHYAYLENLSQTINILNNFLLEKDDK